MSKIELFFEDIKPIQLKRNLVKKQIKNLVEKEGFVLGEISIVFCSDEYLLSINKRYLNHDYFTDIITFNYLEGKFVSGDLFISLERVNENAGIFKNEFREELFRVIFHGVLHLIGYNDKIEEEQKTMRNKENFYLSEVDLSEIEL